MSDPPTSDQSFPDSPTTGPSTADLPPIEIPPSRRVVDRWRWPRRIVMAVALGAAIWFLAVSLEKSPESASRPGPASDPAVVRQAPTPGTQVLRQSSVGVDLLSGYDGSLTINGTAIPEDQLDGVILPGMPGYDPAAGIRPFNRNHVFFTPGPGKVIDRYPTGEVQVTAHFWNIADGRSTSRTVSWVFFVV